MYLKGFHQEREKLIASRSEFMQKDDRNHISLSESCSWFTTFIQNYLTKGPVTI